MFPDVRAARPALGDIFSALRKAVIAGREVVTATRERFIASRQPFIAIREVFIAGRQPFIAIRERFIAGREAFLAGNEPFIASNETLTNVDVCLPRDRQAGFYCPERRQDFLPPFYRAWSRRAKSAESAARAKGETRPQT